MPDLTLGQIEGVLDDLQSRHMAVMRERCARQRHRLSACRRCLDVCPTGAIAWEDGLQIDWDRCQRCGACATVCPTGALEPRLPSNDEIWVQAGRAAGERGWVGFACSRATLPEGAGQELIHTNCLARLDESLLMGVIAYGARSVWLVAGACETCPLGSARAAVERVVHRAGALLAALGRPACIELGTCLPPDLATGAGGQEAADQGVGGVSRRGLFKTLARETARASASARAWREAATPAPSPAGEDGLPTALPDKRLMLMAALERLGRPAEPCFEAGEDGLWAGLEFTADCTACQMCTFFCPTGALIKAAHEDRAGVVYQVSRCVNCNLCRDLCYRQAVVLRGHVDLGQVMSGGIELLSVRRVESAAPWQGVSQERVASAILDSLG